jgi:hypothetical protein
MKTKTNVWLVQGSPAGSEGEIEFSMTFRDEPTTDEVKEAIRAFERGRWKDLTDDLEEAAESAVDGYFDGPNGGFVEITMVELMENSTHGMEAFSARIPPHIQAPEIHVSRGKGAKDDI